MRQATAAEKRSGGVKRGLKRGMLDAGVPAASRQFDGVICFGDSDWWYHNRGHYDMRMMYELNQRVPVLYVNSIGVRMPSVKEGSVFLKRILRKLRSMGRGFVPVREDFGVFSPVTLPGGMGGFLLDALLAFQVRRAARKMGICRPLVWVACPAAARAAERVRRVGLVYQRTDAYEKYPGADREAVIRWDRHMKEQADLTLFCSTLLFEAEKEHCRNARLIDHGVNFELFAAAGSASHPEPADMKSLPRPRVGFVGSIDDHTFDVELFLEVAGRLPEYCFVLVGGCSLPDDWCGLPNVVLLGKRPHEQVPDYMGACNVLIMPWLQNEWIRACNPVKLKEYLAVGKPVVSRPFHELRRYDGAAAVAEDAASFAAAIRAGVEDPARFHSFREQMRRETWHEKAKAVLSNLEGQGLHPVR